MSRNDDNSKEACSNQTNKASSVVYFSRERLGAEMRQSEDAATEELLPISSSLDLSSSLPLAGKGDVLSRATKITACWR